MNQFITNAPLVEDLATGEKRREYQNQKEIQMLREKVEQLERRIVLLEKRK